nr:MAG TPA: hypothetical protein [Bacteriophage sp.]
MLVLLFLLILNNLMFLYLTNILYYLPFFYRLQCPQNDTRNSLQYFIFYNSFLLSFIAFIK